MVVVEASTLLEMLLSRPRAEDVQNRPRVLRRYTLSGDMDEVRAHRAMLHHAGLPIERHPHDPLLRIVWKLRHDARLARAASAFLPVEVFA